MYLHDKAFRGLILRVLSKYSSKQWTTFKGVHHLAYYSEVSFVSRNMQLPCAPSFEFIPIFKLIGKIPADLRNHSWHIDHDISRQYGAQSELA